MHCCQSKTFFGKSEKIVETDKTSIKDNDAGMTPNEANASKISEIRINDKTKSLGPEIAKGETNNLLTPEAKAKMFQVRNPHDLVIEAESKRIIFGKLPRPLTAEAMVAIPYDIPITRVAVANALVCLKNTKDVAIEILNLNSHPITIFKNTLLAKLEPAEFQKEVQVHAVHADSTNNPDLILQELKLEHLSDKTKREVIDLILAHRHLFS